MNGRACRRMECLEQDDVLDQREIDPVAYHDREGGEGHMPSQCSVVRVSSLPSARPLRLAKLLTRPLGQMATESALQCNQY